MYSYNFILVDITDRLAVITLNRPEFSNAFITEEYDEVSDAVTRLDQDESVGAIMFRGAGKNFSAGGNILRFKELIDSGEYISTAAVAKANNMTQTVSFCTKPTVALVNGAAAGAGCSLAVACDFRIVSPSSSFVMSFINLGLSADTGSIFNLARIVGTARAMEIMRLGEKVTGQRAYEIGLATRICEADDDLPEFAVRFASKLAHGPLFAYRRQKQLENMFFKQYYSAYSCAEASFISECSRSKDFAESVNAFLEKRKPVYTGN